MFFNKFSVYIFLALKCLLLVLVEIAKCQNETPCPGVFRYKYDSDFTYGILKIPFPKTYKNTLLLKVELLIEKEVSEQELQDKISYSGTPDDIILKKPLFFKMEFPFWETFFPQIKKISINDELLCISDYINLSQRNDQTPSMVNLYFTIPTFDNSDIVNPDVEKSGKNDFHNKMGIAQSEYFYYADSPFGDSISFELVDKKETEPVERKRIKPVVEDDELSDCGLSAPVISNENDFNLVRAHPWAGSLYREKKSNLSSSYYPSANSRLSCRLTLITHTCALSAGSCSGNDLFELFAIFGKYNIDDIQNSFEGHYQLVKVLTVYKHPDFSNLSITSDADIAIFRFSEKVLFTNYVRPVCLWLMNSDIKRVVNTEGTLIGFNPVTENSSARLKQFFASIVSDETCLRSAGFFSITSNRTFCAGYKDGIGPCSGDGGIGLYISIKGRWFIRGILSKSLTNLRGECDRNDYYVYVDVAKYIDWITNVLYREKFSYFHTNFKL